MTTYMIRHVIVVLMMGVMVSPAVADASQQTAQPGITAANAEGIREHLDEAEDLIESMLDWRHVLTALATSRDDTPRPMAPSSTLISITREEVERLSGYLDAMSALVPKAGVQSAAPRGDLRAHIDKAQEIAREMLPAGASARPVGTSGVDAGLLTFDRTAVERLEIELDAVERLLPRQSP